MKWFLVALLLLPSTTIEGTHPIKEVPYVNYCMDVSGVRYCDSCFDFYNTCWTSI